MRPNFDINSKYSRVPANPSKAFPRKTEQWLPIVQVGLVGRSGRAFLTPALLDTGTNSTMFPADIADVLGLDWKSAPTALITGVGGKTEAHFLEVKMVLVDVNYDWIVNIGFVPGFAIPVPILGHEGFFEHFIVTFRSGPKMFKISLR